MKFKTEKTKNGIWSDWIKPVMTNYHFMCCDCGLVHTINFRAVKVLKTYKSGCKLLEVLPKKDYQVEFKVRRNNKYSKPIK